MSKPSGQTASNTLLLRRQLAELTKRPVEGFSAGKHRQEPHQPPSSSLVASQRPG
jgi:hypothetical protein